MTSRVPRHTCGVGGGTCDGQEDQLQRLVHRGRRARHAVAPGRLSAGSADGAAAVLPIPGVSRAGQNRRPADHRNPNHRQDQESGRGRAWWLRDDTRRSRFRSGTGEARGRISRRQRRELLHHAALVGTARADLLRHLDLPDAAHGCGRHGCRRPDVDRQEQGQDLCREGHQDHARRCRRGRRGQGRGPGDHRFPEGPQGLRRARRAPAARHPPGRPSGHRQDSARPRHRRRGRGDLPLDQRLGIRRDVRRRGGRPRARPVPAGALDGALHHLHRRARRHGPRAWHRTHGGRPRREGADAQPAPGRAGRLRSERGHHPARRDQPAGDPRSRAPTSGSIRSADRGRPSGQARPHPDPPGARAAKSSSTPKSNSSRWRP